MSKNEFYWEKQITEAIENQSEQSDLDFKANISEDNKRLKEHINAFSHLQEGGSFIFGISDKIKPYKFTGSSLDYSDIQHKISNLAQDTQAPPVGVDNYIIKTPIGDVLCIHIHEGVKKPIFIKNRDPLGGNACFKRAAANTVPIPAEEIRIMLAQSTNHTYDESTIQEAKVDDLSFERIEESFPNFKAINQTCQQNINILCDNNIIKQTGDNYLPTIAGFLIFGKKPQSIRNFSNAYIEFQQFRDSSRAIPIKKVDIKGNLQDQLEKSIALLMEHLWIMPMIKTGGKRIEIPAYDEEVIREVMTNALIHRDYTKMYHPVKIALFKDRVEVENIGGLMPGLTTLNFVNKRDWRNPLLAQLTKKTGFGEMDGQGIDRIYSLSRKMQIPTPSFKDDKNSFTAILLGPKKFEDLEPEQKRLSIIVLLIFEKTIDNEFIRNSFDIKPEQATNLIKSMVEEGVLEQENKSRKFAKYRFSNKYQQLVNS